MFKIFSKILQIHEENILLKNAINGILIMALSDGKIRPTEAKDLKNSDIKWLHEKLSELLDELNSYKQNPTNKTENAQNSSN